MVSVRSSTVTMVVVAVVASVSEGMAVVGVASSMEANSLVSSVMIPSPSCNGLIIPIVRLCSCLYCCRRIYRQAAGT